jgi:hypothetical protein
VTTRLDLSFTIPVMSYAPDPTQQPTSAPSYISPYPPPIYQPAAPATTAAQPAAPPEPGTSTRRADELARKDRTLAEFMLMLDEYDPLVSPQPHPAHAPRKTDRFAAVDRSRMRLRIITSSVQGSNVKTCDCACCFS